MDKKAALIPASGIGDALIMMVAAHYFLRNGYETHIFHPELGSLHRWFPKGHLFVDELPSDLTPYDAIVVENDNHPRIAAWRRAYPQLQLLYPTYRRDKHLPLASQDSVFDPTSTMVANIAQAMHDRFPGCASPLRDNGLAPPTESPLVWRRSPHKIAIHPMSRDDKKNWTLDRFVALATRCARRGFDPFFIVHRSERLPTTPFPLFVFDDLEALAALLYESGYLFGNDSLAGHLASNLGIPTLIIADDAERMRLWRPGWREGALLTPVSWIPNIAPWRLRKKYWQRWVTVGRAMRAFARLRTTSELDYTPSG